VTDIESLRAQLRAFVDEREWRQFHDPKSLILALVGEVGELAELFQWLPAEDAAAMAREEPLGRRTADELADVFIYLVLLAESLSIDLLDAAQRKLNAASDRYPPSEHRGVAPQKE
jgi:NTP pyrophosphatase (non-canonical NTP hydrolase)